MKFRWFSICRTVVSCLYVVLLFSDICMCIAYPFVALFWQENKPTFMVIFACTVVAVAIAWLTTRLFSYVEDRTIENIKSRKLPYMCTRDGVIILNLTEFEAMVLKSKAQNSTESPAMHCIIEDSCVLLQPDSCHVVSCGTGDYFALAVLYEKPLGHELEHKFGLWCSCAFEYGDFFNRANFYLARNHMIHALAH